jgi:hypothetical protein
LKETLSGLARSHFEALFATASPPDVRYSLEGQEPLLELDSIHSGFADRCEARLCLAVKFSKSFGLSPWFGLWPINFGAKPEPGA